MAKKFYLFLLLSCFFVQSQAQQESKSLKVEPFFGVAITTFSNADLNSYVGFALGVNLHYQIDRHWGVVSGLGFSNYGTASESGNNLILGYVELPILAKLYVNPRLSFNAGLMGGYCTADAREGWFFDAGARKTYFGIPVGVSYDFKHLTLNAQYLLGLTNAYDSFNYKIRGVRLTVGYKF